MTILSNIIAPTNILSETNTATVSNKTISGSSNTLSNLDAANLASGTVPTARLGSGTADATTFLRGDNTWAVAGGGAFTFLGSYRIQTAGRGDVFTTSPLSSAITTSWFSTYSELKFRITAKTVGSLNQIYLLAQLQNSSSIVISMDYFVTRNILSTSTTTLQPFPRFNQTSGILLYDYAMYDLVHVDFRITSGDSNVSLASTASVHQQWSAEIWGNQQTTYGLAWQKVDGQADVRTASVGSNTIANILLRNNYTTSTSLQTLFDIEVYGK